MDKLLDAYAAWPTDQQMTFLTIALLASAILAFLWSWWLMMFARDFIYYVTVWFRGWPEEVADEAPHASRRSADVVESETLWDRLAALFPWRPANPTEQPRPTLFKPRPIEPERPTPPVTTSQQRVAQPQRPRPPVTRPPESVPTPTPIPEKS